MAEKQGSCHLALLIEVEHEKRGKAMFFQRAGTMSGFLFQQAK
jgi:hypothetical protein